MGSKCWARAGRFLRLRCPASGMNVVAQDGEVSEQVSLTGAVQKRLLPFRMSRGNPSLDNSQSMNGGRSLPGNVEMDRRR